MFCAVHSGDEAAKKNGEKILYLELYKQSPHRMLLSHFIIQSKRQFYNSKKTFLIETIKSITVHSVVYYSNLLAKTRWLEGLDWPLAANFYSSTVLCSTDGWSLSFSDACFRTLMTILRNYEIIDVHSNLFINEWKWVFLFHFGGHYNFFWKWGYEK